MADNEKKAPGNKAEETVSKAEFDELMKKVAELEADKAAGPSGAESRPVIIAQPMTQGEAAEADRLKQQKQAEAEAEAWLNETVTVQLFKDGKDYKDDVYLSINGNNLFVKRGVPVTMKRKFALLIDQSEIQSLKAAEYCEEQSNAYREAAKANIL